MSPLEIEEIMSEPELEVKERVVFATMEREVWSDGQIKKMIRRKVCSNDKMKP